MYSQYTAQHARPAQLPPCVPMNPDTKTPPRSAAKPTARETLQKRAHQIAMGVAIEATANHPTYDVLAWDTLADIVTLGKAMYPNDEPYLVDRKNLTCTCPHFVHRISRVNEELVAAGLPGSLLCKHFPIIDEKLTIDPDILFNAPTYWSRERAESLTGFGDEFDARRKADF